MESHANLKQRSEGYKGFIKNNAKTLKKHPGNKMILILSLGDALKKAKIVLAHFLK